MFYLPPCCSCPAQKYVEPGGEVNFSGTISLVPDAAAAKAAAPVPQEPKAFSPPEAAPAAAAPLPAPATGYTPPAPAFPPMPAPPPIVNAPGAFGFGRPYGRAVPAVPLRAPVDGGALRYRANYPGDYVGKTNDFHGYSRLTEDPFTYTVTSVFPKYSF